MSIRKITDGEIEAASVARLSDRPNESGGYGRSAMTASELRQAFDALGKLCASRYNELCTALSDGSAAGEIKVGDMTLDEILLLLREKADTDTVAEGLMEVDAVLRSLVSEDAALGQRLSDLQKETEGTVSEINEALGEKLDTERYLDTPAVKGGELLPVTLCSVSGGVLSIVRKGEGFVIRKGASLSVGSTAAYCLASFPVVKGERYCVYTKEDYPARYYADIGDEQHTHIIDGMRLRVTIDLDGDGKEDRLYKHTNSGMGSDRLIYTSEPICFTAEEDGVADISLSVYNMSGSLAFPFAEADAPISVCVSRIPPASPLVLDREMKPGYSEGEGIKEGDTLLSVPLPDHDSFGKIALPVSVSGNVAHLHIRGGHEVTAVYDKEGVRILKGSRQPGGMWYDLMLGEFSAVKGRSYRVFTRESHLLGEYDGYYLAVTDGTRTYQKTGEGLDTHTGFVFTAERSGKHKVAMHVYCDGMSVPEIYTEDLRISAFAVDITPKISEKISGSLTASAGESTVVSVTELPSGIGIAEAESIGIRLMGCRAGESYQIEIEDGNGKKYTETRAVNGAVEVFVLDMPLWTARVSNSTAAEKMLLLPFGRESYPSTKIRSVRVLYQAASPANLRYVIYAR